MTWQEGVGWVLLFLGVVSVWTGGLMSRRLRPTGGAPHELSPDWRAVLRQILAAHAIGTVLILAGVACLVWGR